MQPLNFTQLSSKKHKAVRIWFAFSSTLIGIFLGVCTYLTMHQWKRYTAVKITSRANQVPLKNNKKVAHQNNTTKILQSVQNKLTADTHLESLAVTDSQIEFKISGTTIKAISTVAQQLQAVNHEIQLCGLQNSDQKVIGSFTY